MVDFDAIRRGMDVVDARGKRLGKVLTRGNGRFLVQRTTLIVEQHIIDDDFVDRIEGNTVLLAVDEATLEASSTVDEREKPSVGSRAAADQPSDRVRPPDAGDAPEGEHVAMTGGSSVKTDRDDDF